MGGSRPENQDECAMCGQRRQDGVELYEIRGGEDLYYFNVEKARRIAADGRPAIRLPDATVRKLVAVNDYDPRHLPHTDPARPGIILVQQGGLVLVDGVHRAARSLLENRPFYAQALNERESRQCLVRKEAAAKAPEEDAVTLVRRLRGLIQGNPGSGIIEVELTCGPEILARVRALLAPEERRRLRLRARAGPGGGPASE